MCNIENLKRAFKQTGMIKERVELAITIQRAPVTQKTIEHLAEILGYINDRVNHLHNNLEKGIAIEQELLEIEELVKDMPGTEVFIIAADIKNVVNVQNKPGQ